MKPTTPLVGLASVGKTTDAITDVLKNMDQENMPADANNWISVKTSMPPVGTPVRCQLEHWNTKGIVEYELIHVLESDCLWRTADDNSEISYDWNVITWTQPHPNPNGIDNNDNT